jgi:hypothetical protein
MAKQYEVLSAVGLEPTSASPLAFGIDLGPQVDASLIRVNQTAARRQLRLAGLGGVIMGMGVEEDFAHDPEPPKEKLTISGFAGVTGTGGAVAMGSLMRSRDKRSTEMGTRQTGSTKYLLPNYDWPQARININKPVLGERVRDARQRHDISNEEAWAAELDRSFRRGVHRQAKELLATYNKPYDPFYMTNAAFAVGDIALAFGAILRPELINSLPALFMANLFMLGLEMRNNLAAHGSTLLRQRRWSILPAATGQFDRYAAATIALSSGSPIFSVPKQRK